MEIYFENWLNALCCSSVCLTYCLGQSGLRRLITLPSKIDLTSGMLLKCVRHSRWKREHCLERPWSAPRTIWWRNAAQTAQWKLGVTLYPSISTRTRTPYPRNRTKHANRGSGLSGQGKWFFRDWLHHIRKHSKMYYNTWICSAGSVKQNVKLCQITLKLVCDFELTPLFTLMEIYCLAPATLSTDTCHTRSYQYLQCKATIS